MSDKPDDEPRRAGRPKGSLNRLAKAAREAAAATGKLPHEILLDIARGNPVTVMRLDVGTSTYRPQLVEVDVELVIDAAKAGAPYFAPKIATVEVIQGVDDDALDAIIESAAAQAGVSLGAGGEGEEEEGEGGEGEAPSAAPPPRRRPVT